MAKKIYVVLALCLLCVGLPVSVKAQQTTVVKGIVRDSITHEPISYASVFFVGSDKGVMTDDDGKFAVAVRDNFLNVRIATLGYREKTVFVKKGAENNLEVDLVPSDYTLQEVVVKPKKEKYSKKNNPAVEFVKKLIERLRTESLYADKASLEIMDLCMEAATAISTLQAENEKLRDELDEKEKYYDQMIDALSATDSAELEQVKRERDAAVKCIEEIEDALNFQRMSAIRLRISEWRGQKED